MVGVLREALGIRVLALRRSERGNELIELALLSVLFFSLVFGIMEFGRAVWIYGTVAHVAREGARWAAVRGSESGHAASAADIQAYVQNRASGMAVAAVTTTWHPDNDPGSVVQVRVERAFNPIVPLVGLGPIALTSTSRIVIAF